MMTNICHYYDERAWVQNQWEHVLSHYDINDSYEIDSDKAKRFIPTIHIDSISELPKGNRILLAHKDAKYIKGVKNLKDYVHKEDNIYIFGHDNRNIHEEEFDDVIYIPVKYEMYSFVACATVLYDIESKNG